MTAHRVRWLLLVAVVLLFVITYFVPLPSGLVGASRVASPPQRVQVARDLGDWAASAAGGRAVLFYVATVSGGESETGTPLPDLYSEFRGVVLRSSWPFVLRFRGYVGDNAVGGYRAQYEVDDLGISDTQASALSDADRRRVRRLVPSLLQASGAGAHYDAAAVADSLGFGNTDGSLGASALLPPTASGGSMGDLSISLANGAVPSGAWVDTKRDF